MTPTDLKQPSKGNRRALKIRKAGYAVIPYLLLGSYLALCYSFGQPFFSDEIAYKCAGLHWATTGAYAAPEETGLVDADPPVDVVWAAYPPLYTFSFGVVVKAFGFDWRTSVLFDAMIRVILAWLTYRLTRCMNPTISLAWAWFAGLAVVPLGQTGRPDEFAMCFGMAGILAIIGGPIGPCRSVLAGFLLGLSGSGSPGVAVVFWIAHFVFLSGCEGGWSSKSRLAALLGMSAVGTTVFVCFPILFTHPGAIHQFLKHASYAANSNLYDDLQTVYRVEPFKLITSCGFAIIGIVGVSCQRSRFALQLWLGALIGLAIVMLASPIRYTYYWFVGPLMLSGGVALVQYLRTRFGHVCSAPVAVVLFSVILLGSLPWLHQVAILVSLPRSQSLDYNMELVASSVPKDSVVLTDQYWWALAGNSRVYDIRFAFVRVPKPELLEEIDYVILGGPVLPDSPAELLSPVLGFRPDLHNYIRMHFVVISDYRNTEPIKLLSVRQTRHRYGFGPVILARNPPRHGQIRDTGAK